MLTRLGFPKPKLRPRSIATRSRSEVPRKGKDQSSEAAVTSMKYSNDPVFNDQCLQSYGNQPNQWTGAK